MEPSTLGKPTSSFKAVFDVIQSDKQNHTVFQQFYSTGGEDPPCSALPGMAEKLCEAAKVGGDENQLDHMKSPALFATEPHSRLLLAEARGLQC